MALSANMVAVAAMFPRRCNYVSLGLDRKMAIKYELEINTYPENIYIIQIQRTLQIRLLNTNLNIRCNYINFAI